MKSSSFNALVASLQQNELNFSERSIPFNYGAIRLFYIAQLTDKAALMENVVKPLVLYCASTKTALSARLAAEGIIYADDVRLESDTSRIEDLVLSGMTIILFSTDNEYIVVNLKKVAHRVVSKPELTYTLRGAQDCFTENLDVNLSLIRNRVKDKNIRIKNFDVGVRTKTRVAVIYIKDIANDTVVNEMQKRIERINVDCVSESGELQNLLLNKKLQLFPHMGLIERSDMASHSLLEGKVLLLTEGSGIALLAPKTFSEFFYSCDDRYDNKLFGLLMRILRYIALSIALIGSSLFVSISSFHTDVLPTKYAITLAESRVNVPFNGFIGAILLEFIVELIREALLRVPKQIGSAIGIVGAIVIGQAAIASGIFSPLLLIIVAVSLLASFAIPDYTLMNSFRVLKLILLLLTGAMGFFGFTLVLTFILIELVSLNSFGVPYMAPWAPFNFRDFIGTLISNSTINPKRPGYLRLKDKTRAK